MQVSEAKENTGLMYDVLRVYVSAEMCETEEERIFYAKLDFVMDQWPS